MANKRKGTTQRRQAADDQGAANPIQLVVRRGALRRYAALKRDTAELPVLVSWDRRTVERRGEIREVRGDRRRTDRRQQPPFTWELADFVVVCQTSEPSIHGAVEDHAKE